MFLKDIRNKLRSHECNTTFIYWSVTLKFEEGQSRFTYWIYPASMRTMSLQSRSAAALKKNLLLELLPHCSGKVLIQLGLRLIFRPQQYSQCDTFRKRATISHTNSTLRVACHLLIAADIIQQGKPIERDRRHKLIGGFVLPYTSVSLSLFFFYSCIKNAKKKKGFLFIHKCK